MIMVSTHIGECTNSQYFTLQENYRACGLCLTKVVLEIRETVAVAAQPEDPGVVLCVDLQPWILATNDSQR